MGLGYKSVAKGLIFTLITCGIYNIFWNIHLMRTCNELTGREEFEPLRVYLLALVTCGIYYVYYKYRMGGVIVEIQRARSQPTSGYLPLIGLFLTLFALGPIADAIDQHALNKFYPRSPAV